MQRFHSMISLTLLTAILVSGFLVFGCDRRPQSQPAPPARQVATVTMESQEVLLTTELPGRTSAYRIAEIRPQVSGLIKKRLFTEGSDVTAGEVLYEIDPAPFQAALDNAKAALQRAESGLPAIRSQAERFEKALAEKAVSSQDYDNVVAALKQVEADIQYGQASVKTARINLSYCQITAPISGRIGRSNVTEGAIVTAYQPVPLATIQQLDPVYVDVPQSTTQLLRLQKRLKDGRLEQGRPGQDDVILTLEDGSPYPQKGRLQFSDVTVDPTTGSVILRIVFPNPDGTLLPGMFVRAQIKEGINPSALLVPQQGVSRDHKGNPYALTVDAENTVALKPLTLDRAMGDKWLIVSGLVPGDRIIMEGLQGLRPGTIVKAIPFQSAQNAKPAAEVSGTPPKKPVDGGA